MHAFRGLRLKYKFFLCFLIIILINTVGIGLFSYYKYSEIMLNNAGEYASQILKQDGHSINNTYTGAKTISNLLTFDSSVQNTLINAPQLSTLPTGTRRDLLASLEGVMVNHFDYLIMRSIMIIDNQENVLGRIVSFYLDTWTFGTDGRLEEMLEKADEADGKFVWFNNVSSHDTITIVRRIRSFETFQPLGYMVMDLNANYLEDTMASIELEDNWSLILMDWDGAFIASTGTSADGMDPALFEQVQSKGESGYFAQKNQAGQDTLYCYYHLEDMDQYLVGTILVAQLTTDSIRVAQAILTMGLLLILFSILISLYMTRSVTKPIYRVIHSLKKVTAGNLDTYVEMTASDEIGDLIVAFNQMVAKIKELLEKNMLLHTLQRDAEFKALQAQINPHFLYNALETINWMAKNKGADDICHMINALSILMRTSINSKKAFVNIEEELNYVEEYIFIQNTRYNGRIHYQIDVDPSILHYKIPKLIIQPVVENAIVHGLEPKMSEGDIRVRIVAEAGQLTIDVTDDGVGMLQEEADQILKNATGNTEGISHLGMGLYNVHQRIQLYYGEKYGLTITSSLNGGTTVHMVLPGES